MAAELKHHQLRHCGRCSPCTRSPPSSCHAAAEQACAGAAASGQLSRRRAHARGPPDKQAAAPWPASARDWDAWAREQGDDAKLQRRHASGATTLEQVAAVREQVAAAVRE